MQETIPNGVAEDPRTDEEHSQEKQFPPFTGFLEASPRPTDWLMGAETGIVPVIRVADGNWSPYLPTDERQSNRKMDSLACTNFSFANAALEMQINRMVAIGELTGDKLEKCKELGYFDQCGKANFSDRFLAKISGTGKNGNYMVNSPDAIRKFGLVGEKDWPFTDDMDWDTYYMAIPPEIMQKAKAFLDIFDIKYEWTSKSQIPEALKEAPVTIAAPVCPGWNNQSGIVPTCDLTVSQHVTSIYAMDEDRYLDFDHYVPFRKSLDPKYPILAVMKTVLTIKQPPEVPQKPVHTFNITLVKGQRSNEVFWLQKCLAYLGYLKVPYDGYFGNNTFNAVCQLQEDKKSLILKPAGLTKPTGNVGFYTRSYLNTIFGE